MIFQIFFSVNDSFVSLLLSLAVTYEIQFNNFFLMNSAFDVLSKKYLINLRPQRFSPVFSYRRLSFTFKTMTHFK